LKIISKLQKSYKAELASFQVAVLAIPYGSEQCSFPLELKEAIILKD